MKKYLLSFLLSTAAYAATAQISIQPVLPLAGIIQKNTLWNIAVVNTSADTYNCRLELTLRDRMSGMEILTATTGRFDVAAGAKQLNAGLLLPVQYNYLSPATAARTDDFIPVGSYIACYRLTSTKNIVAEECASFDVEPLSPPMLIMPADSSVLDVQPSQFNWVPPAPMNLFSRLQYEVVITEIYPGQKAEEAMQQNLPFYTEPNLPVNNLTYKGMASSFEKDKWYAWQVIAKDDNNYAGKSEVWVFKVTDPVTPKDIAGGFYLLMDDHPKGNYEVTGKVLHLKYFSYSAGAAGKIIFKNRAGAIVKVAEQPVKQGDNYFDFNLGNQFKSGEIYIVSIEDKDQKTYTVTFSIK